MSQVIQTANKILQKKPKLAKVAIAIFTICNGALVLAWLELFYTSVYKEAIGKSWEYILIYRPDVTFHRVSDYFDIMLVIALYMVFCRNAVKGFLIGGAMVGAHELIGFYYSRLVYPAGDLNYYFGLVWVLVFGYTSLLVIQFALFTPRNWFFYLGFISYAFFNIWWMYIGYPLSVNPFPYASGGLNTFDINLIESVSWVWITAIYVGSFFFDERANVKKTVAMFSGIRSGLARRYNKELAKSSANLKVQNN